MRAALERSSDSKRCTSLRFLRRFAYGNASVSLRFYVPESFVEARRPERWFDSGALTAVMRRRSALGIFANVPSTLLGKRCLNEPFLPETTRFLEWATGLAQPFYRVFEVVYPFAQVLDVVWLSTASHPYGFTGV